MSRLVSALLILITCSFAQAMFQIEAAVAVNPNVVQAEACNYGYNAPIICRTTAYGMLPNGMYINAWTNIYLAPGQCDYAYVYANSGYYFVNGYATSYCEFSGY